MGSCGIHGLAIQGRSTSALEAWHDLVSQFLDPPPLTCVMSSACALAGGISGSHKRVRACCLLFTLFVCAHRSVRFWSCAAGVALTELCDERAEPHNLCNSARCRQAAHSVVCVRQPPERERHLQAGSSTGRPLLSRCVRLSPSTHLHSQCQGLAVAHLCHKGGGHAQAVRCVTESQPSHAATPSFSAQWQPVRANRQARCSRGVPATCTRRCRHRQQRHAAATARTHLSEPPRSPENQAKGRGPRSACCAKARAGWSGGCRRDRCRQRGAAAGAHLANMQRHWKQKQKLVRPPSCTPRTLPCL